MTSSHQILKLGFYNNKNNNNNNKTNNNNSKHNNNCDSVELNLVVNHLVIYYYVNSFPKKKLYFDINIFIEQ